MSSRSRLAIVWRPRDGRRAAILVVTIALTFVAVGVIVYRLHVANDCNNCACVEVFERDPRFLAVKQFDREACRAMREKAEARRERGHACAPALNAELRPTLLKIVKRALRK